MPRRKEGYPCGSPDCEHYVYLRNVIHSEDGFGHCRICKRYYDDQYQKKNLAATDNISEV